MKRIFVSLMLISLFSNVTFAVTGAFFSVDSSGSEVTITTTVPNHTYPNAGIKVNSPGYTLNTTGCTPNSNGYCLFSVSNTSTKTLTISGPLTKKLSITLCLNGKGPLTCQEYSVPEHFAYIVNSGNDSVSLCNVNASTGNISGCVDSGANNLSTPYNIVLNATGTFAYVTNSTAGGQGVTRCEIDQNTRALNNCQLTGSGMSVATQLAFNPEGNRAYISNQGSAGDNSVSLCSVDLNTGLLNNCGSAGSMPPPGRLGVALNSTGTNLYTAVIGSIINNTVNTSTGFVTSGPGVGLTTTWMTSITVNSSDTFGYFAVNTSAGGPNNGVFVCAISSSGIIPGASACAINAQGVYGALTYGAPAFNFAENLMYLANNETNIVSKCVVSLKTGLLSNCVNSGATGLNDPQSLAFIR